MAKKPKRAAPKIGPPNEIYHAKGFLVCHEVESDDDNAEWESIEKRKEDARKAAGTWPDVTDRSELGMKRIGQAIRQTTEFAEGVYYAPIGKWLAAHRADAPYHAVMTEDRGRICLIDFVTETGRQAFLSEHPNWLTERPKQWYDGVQTMESVYDLPDDEDDA